VILASYFFPEKGCNSDIFYAVQINSLLTQEADLFYEIKVKSVA